MAASGLARVRAVAANTFRETVRERVLYNLVFFAILMTVSGLLMRQLSIRQDDKIIKDFGLAAMDLFGTAIAVLIGVGLVSKEIERRSLYPLLAKPLRREEFLAGKFAGLGFTLLVNISFMSLGLYATLMLTGRHADPQLLKAIYGIYLSLLLTVALSLLFSTLTSPAVAAICTLGLVVAGRFSDVIQGAKDVAPQVPAWLVSFLYFAIPNFRDFDLKNHVVYGDPVAWSSLAWITAYAAVYVTLTLGLAIYSFSRRDLP